MSAGQRPAQTAASYSLLASFNPELFFFPETAMASSKSI
jgi:hypothetical protein